MKTILTRKVLAGLSVGLAAGYFVAGLWPFEFRPINRVTWRTDRPGLHFEPDSIAYVPGPEPRVRPADSTGQPANFTVELYAEAGLDATLDLLYILTIDDGRLPPDFALCQWNSEFLLRTTPTNGSSSSKIRETGFPGAFEKQKTRVITVTGSESGIDFYLNGLPVRHVPDFVIDSTLFQGQLLLGNTASGKHSWTGDLFGLAIFNRSLNAAEVAQHFVLWTNAQAGQLTGKPGLTALFLFDEGHGSEAMDRSANHRPLLIPEVYFVPRKEILISPLQDLAFDLSHPSDILLNILGFVPFGFCFLLYRRESAPSSRAGNALLVILTGFVISLAIELIQVWLPNRVSSATDLLCNTAGTLLGVLLGLALERFRASRSHDFKSRTAG